MVSLGPAASCYTYALAGGPSRIVNFNWKGKGCVKQSPVASPSQPTAALEGADADGQVLALAAVGDGAHTRGVLVVFPLLVAAKGPPLAVHVHHAGVRGEGKGRGRV